MIPETSDTDDRSAHSEIVSPRPVNPATVSSSHVRNSQLLSNTYAGFDFHQPSSSASNEQPSSGSVGATGIVGGLSAEVSPVEGLSIGDILAKMAPAVVASPPTPAPSPDGTSRNKLSAAAASSNLGGIASTTAATLGWNNHTADQHEKSWLQYVRDKWPHMSTEEKQRCLTEIINLCNPTMLMFMSSLIAPRLKRDFLKELPVELGLRILSHVDDPRTLARASQVSKAWYNLVNDDHNWKILCRKHRYRRLSTSKVPSTPASAETFQDPWVTTAGLPLLTPTTSLSHQQQGLSMLANFSSPSLTAAASTALPPIPPSTTAILPKFSSPTPESPTPSSSTPNSRPHPTSYRSHFRQRWQVENAWLRGGRYQTRGATPDSGVVTTLLLTPEYVIVGLDSSKIHIFDEDGYHIRTLMGHETGVWAMVSFGDTLVSGGCDRDVRVWSISTGRCTGILRGHTSTVRCLRMRSSSKSERIAISGSRDSTLRVWDVEKGLCKRILLGHHLSVRCIEVKGDICVSGSYDCTARVWNISKGTCLQVLTGHQSQIYAVAFDGRHIVTGSLDSTMRVWNFRTGQALGVLSGHTSLVGQLQIRGDILVSGGSDGAVRVWDLRNMECVHRLAAHDNSVTSLQFDDRRIVSAGSDGHVKLWNLQTGAFIREMTAVADSIWRVAFEEERLVIMAARGNRTFIEIINFLPVEGKAYSCISHFAYAL